MTDDGLSYQMSPEAMAADIADIEARAVAAGCICDREREWWRTDCPMEDHRLLAQLALHCAMRGIEPHQVVLRDLVRLQRIAKRPPLET